MSTIKVRDGTTIYYKDWSKGPAGWDPAQSMRDNWYRLVLATNCSGRNHDHCNHPAPAGTDRGRPSS